MKDVVIVYSSKYGSTKRYAEMIRDRLGEGCCQIITEKDAKISEVLEYNTVVIGGGIRGGGIYGINVLKKNYAKLKENNKKILTFAVGLNVEADGAYKQLREINFTKKLSEIPCFMFRGAYNPKNVKGIDKMLMKFIYKMVSGKGDLEKSKSDRELLDAMENGCDYVDEKYIEPLIVAIRGSL